MSDTTTDQLVDSLQDWWIGLTIEEKRRVWELYQENKTAEKNFVDGKIMNKVIIYKTNLGDIPMRLCDPNGFPNL